MDEWRKKARAREQLYHLLVQWRQLQERLPPSRRTPELDQVVATVQGILDATLKAYESGAIMEVLVNTYHMVQHDLPGMEEVEMKSPNGEDWD